MRSAQSPPRRRQLAAQWQP
ncbi:hypothetical protein PG987_010879 [Apiospora arundinis]